jgi:hypothetical protein
MKDGTEPAVHRIDPATNEAIATVALPGRLCQGIGASPEAVWACGPDGLVPIDPATNEVVDAIESVSGPGDVVAAFGSVWVTTTERGDVLRLEP